MGYKFFIRANDQILHMLHIVTPVLEIDLESILFNGSFFITTNLDIEIGGDKINKNIPLPCLCGYATSFRVMLPWILHPLVEIMAFGN